MAYLRLAPYALIVLLTMAVGWFWWSADNAKAARDKAQRELEIALQVNEANKVTIRTMGEWRDTLNARLLDLGVKLTALTKQSQEVEDEIEKLKQSDEEVRKYLSIPIPRALKCVLNRDKNCGKK